MEEGGNPVSDAFLLIRRKRVRAGHAEQIADGRAQDVGIGAALRFIGKQIGRTIRQPQFSLGYQDSDRRADKALACRIHPVQGIFAERRAVALSRDFFVAHQHKAVQRDPPCFQTRQEIRQSLRGHTRLLRKIKRFVFHDVQLPFL